jgi:hypothetical protein
MKLFENQWFFTDDETEVKDVEESNEDSPEGEKHQFKSSQNYVSNTFLIFGKTRKNMRGR